MIRVYLTPELGTGLTEFKKVCSRIERKGFKVMRSVSVAGYVAWVEFKTEMQASEFKDLYL